MRGRWIAQALPVLATLSVAPRQSRRGSREAVAPRREPDARRVRRLGPLARPTTMTRPDRPEKSKWLTLGLNFLVPGAGLAYLGYWRGGLANLAFALAAILVATLALSPEALLEYRSMIGSGIAGLSIGAAWAAYDRYAGNAPA